MTWLFISLRICIKEKKLYPSASKFTTYIPVSEYPVSSCNNDPIVLFFIEGNIIKYMISFTFLRKDFCSCRYITSFCIIKIFLLKDYSHRLINMIFVTYNRQHTHTRDGYCYFSIIPILLQ